VTYVLDGLKAGKQVRDLDFKSTDLDAVNSLCCLTAKPVVYLVNLSEPDFIRKKNKWLAKIKEWVDSHGGGLIIPFSGVFESKILAMEADEREKYCKEVNATSSIGKIAKQGYSHLQLIHFFTGGEDEVKCWTIKKGTKAPQAAGTIHTDFEKGFICAEVMKYDELHSIGSEAAVKEQGKYRQQGKNYVVEDGDIIFFKFNTPNEGKKK